MANLKPYDCLFACHGRDADGQHSTWSCLAGKHGHKGEHRFAFEHATGEPYIDEPMRTNPDDFSRELAALRTIVEALESRPSHARQRMMRYLLSRYGSES
jgi:hypothetical protein